MSRSKIGNIILSDRLLDLVYIYNNYKGLVRFNKLLEMINGIDKVISEIKDDIDVLSEEDFLFYQLKVNEFK